MNEIGGNAAGTIQTATIARNAIGEQVKTWADAQALRGFLDLIGGSAGYSAYSAKIQESTHIFICDFVPLAAGITAETSRMIIGGEVYDVTLIDDPMNLHDHLEIYLKYTGGA